MSDWMCLGGFGVVLRVPPHSRRVRFFDEVMSFRPAHTLAAHRPLGSGMRARLQVYQALNDLRRRENGVAGQEPAGVDAIPARSHLGLKTEKAVTPSLEIAYEDTGPRDAAVMLHLVRHFRA